MSPDIVLIEGPPDADDILHYVSHPETKPPVALLVYNPKDLRQASYFPYTDFSPEWTAIQFAHRKRIPVKHMDLPMSLKYALDPDEQNEMPVELLEREPEMAALVADPLGYISRLAGYADSERWWEATFEQGFNGQGVFEAVHELMSVLRHELNPPESPLTLRREAFMRQTIRTAEREMYERIAVVCGAWHGPVLDPKLFKEKDDAALLKGIKKVKVVSTWIPWSYERVSRLSGYGAGIISPAWYRLLFQNREAAVREWMVRVAQLLRAEDLDASSAHAIEAVRLAETLAALRGHALPGIGELREAAVSIFCSGYDNGLDLVEKKLIIGDAFGEVPSEIPMIPLQEDFEFWCKKFRLKPSDTASGPLELDLRLSPQLEKSRFLYRLNLVGIPWGKVVKGEKSGKGTFWEVWSLAWKPEFALHLIEAGMWGNTVEVAATNVALDRSGKLDQLSQVTEMLQSVLLAHLPQAIAKVSERLRDLAVLTRDVSELLGALPPLVEVYRYSDVRSTDQADVGAILEQLVPRLVVGLPAACCGIAEEVADERLREILKANRSIATLNIDAHREHWSAALSAISGSEAVHPLLNGAAVRLQHDAKLLDTDATAKQVSLALSSANEPNKAGRWLEGFLHGSGLLLIHHVALWKLVDAWVNSLGEEHFQMVLPLLRRTFANFQAPERQKMLNAAKRLHAPESGPRPSRPGIDTERAEPALALVRLLLQ